MRKLSIYKSERHIQRAYRGVYYSQCMGFIRFKLRNSSIRNPGFRQYVINRTKIKTTVMEIVRKGKLGCY